MDQHKQDKEDEEEKMPPAMYWKQTYRLVKFKDE